ncbi:MAG: BatD family protein [Chitinophagaceae bacterium]|nr:BatD family protein [Chitinophagaceae bacterium]
MKKLPAILLLLLFSYYCPSQPLRLIVPSAPIITGEPFRIQYIVADGKTASNLIIPDFSPLQLITGPDVYLGETIHSNIDKQLKNYVFTLVASRPGNYTIPTATIIIDNKTVKGTPAIITAVPPIKQVAKEAPAGKLPGLYIEKGEKTDKKIRNNLFAKVRVNKRICYTGEPVLADFKLYSAIETSSEIIKNPGFYGFSVFDIESLNPEKVTAQIINGKTFNVHTIRTVELYPLQPGTFFIDPMEIKTEVVITTGLSGEIEENYELNMQTENIPVSVLPLPDKNKPVSFTGAVGQFTISAVVEKNNIAANEQGFFDLTITGEGNLIQLEPPVINWPKGTDGFLAETKDSFDILQKGTPEAGVFGFPLFVLLPAVISFRR